MRLFEGGFSEVSAKTTRAGGAEGQDAEHSPMYEILIALASIAF